MAYSKGMEHISDSDIRSLLSHPDAHVRSLADWTREFRGNGWRNWLPSEYGANTYEAQLTGRLRRLAELGLTASPKLTL